MFIPRIFSSPLITAALLGSCMVVAAPGDLDTTFGGGGDGWVSTGFDRVPSWDAGYAVVNLPDGKLLTVGSSDSVAGYLLVRHNTDGSLDTTFGDNGIVNGVSIITGDTSFVTPADSGRQYSMARQTDGKFLVAGSTWGVNYDFAVARHHADGSLDTSFGNGGVVVSDIAGSADVPYSIIQQTDGRIVAVGYSYVSSYPQFSVLRYNIDGTLDTTFSGDGKHTISFGTGAYSTGRSVIQQSDGKLVIAGYTENGNNVDYSVVRLTSSGAFDSFGTAGKVTVSLGESDWGYAVIQQQDGKLVIAGLTRLTQYDEDAIALVRLNSNGSLDSNFAGSGKVTTYFESFVYANAVLQQTDGKLVVSGSSWNGSNSVFAIARYHSDGSLDTTFSDDGKQTAEIGNVGCESESFIQQADEKFVLAGTCGSDIALMRFDNGGTLDTSFDLDGKVTTNISMTSQDDGYAVLRQSDGKLVVAGSSLDGSYVSDFALARYMPDGTLDTTFGSNGKVTTDIDPAQEQERIMSVIQQADGKLVAAGFSGTEDCCSSSFVMVIARYTLDGTLDEAFGDNGIVTLSLGEGATDKAYSIIQTNDGKLVVTGFFYDGEDSDFAVIRLNTDGSLDTSFGGTGKVITDIGNSDESRVVIQQADGKLVVAGSTWLLDGYLLVFVRYNLDGSLDNSFGVNGIVTVNAGLYDHVIYALIQQADGKLVAAGYTYNESDDVVVIRLDNDGSMDTTFNETGIVVFDLEEGGYERARSLVQQGDGKLVMVVQVEDAGDVLLRYNTDGSLDEDFGSSGMVTVDVGEEYYVYVDAVLHQPDGKLVIAGTSLESEGSKFFVARYLSGQPDTDGDGVLDINDAFPLNPTEWLDTDGDGIGNNADWDDDGDGIPDVVDAGNSSEIALPLDGIYKGGRLGSGVLAP